MRGGEKDRNGGPRRHLLRAADIAGPRATGVIVLGLSGLLLATVPDVQAAGDSAAAASPPAGAAMGDGLRRARINQLIVEGKLAEACEELQRAYAASRDPQLLLREARLRQRLGDDKAAGEAYRRFLREAPDPHPGLRAEAEEALRQLARKEQEKQQQPVPPPATSAGEAPPLPPPPALYDPSLPTPPELLTGDVRRVPARLELRRDVRLMKIGALLLGGGYLPALVVPLALSGSLDMENAPTPASNYTVLIPVVGPLVSGIVAPATNPNGHAGQLISSWSIPWILTSGLLQATGLALIIKGSLRRPTLVEESAEPPARAKPPARPAAPTPTSVSLAPWLAGDGGGLVLSGRVQ